MDATQYLPTSRSKFGGQRDWASEIEAFHCLQRARFISCWYFHAGRVFFCVEHYIPNQTPRPLPLWHSSSFPNFAWPTHWYPPILVLSESAAMTYQSLAHHSPDLAGGMVFRGYRHTLECNCCFYSFKTIITSIMLLSLRQCQCQYHDEFPQIAS